MVVLRCKSTGLHVMRLILQLILFSCDIIKKDAWFGFVQDLENLPTRRLSKISSKSDVRETISQKRLQRAFYSSPNLVQLYIPTTHSLNDSHYNSSESVAPFKRLVDCVGLIHKRRLIQMLVRHPNAMASVLKSSHLRVRYLFKAILL
jgi:hypothetical protein